MAQSIFSQLLAELQRDKNHNASIERCRTIIKDLGNALDKRVIAYFSSEVGNDAAGPGQGDVAVDQGSVMGDGHGR